MRKTLLMMVGLWVAGIAGSTSGDEVLDVVVTELMYNPASGDKREDFIELYNRSATETYNLDGWFFEEGVDFTFPNIDLAPQSYLVVCADQARIQQLYGITNTVGNWNPDTTLDNGGERIRLLNDELVEIEDFTYNDRNPWPILADGFGHSLERRSVDADNDDPANWTASGAGSTWTKVSVTGVATSTRIYIYLTAAGEAFIDDIRIFPVGNPGDNRIVNGDFEGGDAGWTATGTQSGSATTTGSAHGGSRSMRIVATGAGASSGDSISRDDLALTIDEQYTLEFWLRTTDPSQSVAVRLSGSGGEASPIEVEAGGGGATPGLQNSAWTTNVPPFIWPVELSPEAPNSADTVFVLATVRDDFDVTSVTLHWDDGSQLRTIAMLDNGNNNDGAAGDGVYGANIGSYAQGTIVRYWVTASDNEGASGRLPFTGNPTPNFGFYIEPPGINPTFQPRNNNGYPDANSGKPPVYHFLIDPSQLGGDGHLNGDLRQYRPGTFVYNGDVFDNVRIRHRGQTSLGRPKKHWKVDFRKDHRFRTPFDGHPEVDNINVQSSEGDKSFLREWLAYKAFMDVGLPGLEMWHVRLYLNGVYRGLYVHLENPNADWLDRVGLDEEGWLWKSYSQARDGGTGGFEIKAGDAARGNAALSSFLSAVNSRSGASLDTYINDNMDVDAFVDFLALHQLIHNADHPAKNYLVYADEDAPAGSWTYLIWDGDLSHGRNFECSDCGLGGGVWNDCMRFDMWGDQRLLFGTQLRPKCDGPWNGVINSFLVRTGTFRDRFYSRTEELLGQLYHPDVLLPIIDDMAAPLVSEVALDWQRNRPTYGRRNGNNDYTFHVNELKTWVRNRYDYLSDALGELSTPGIDALDCTRVGDSVELSWTNRSAYQSIRVYRNDVLIRTLAGSAQATTEPLDLGQSINNFRVAEIVGGNERPGQSCTILITTGGFTQVINEDFSPPVPASQLAVNQDASQVNGVLQLTEPAGGQAGCAFFRTKLPTASFIADFDLRFDDPSDPGADGMVFIINTGDETASCGAAGGAMGYFTGDGGTPVFSGYAVVFDTWQNAGEVSHNWAGFIDASAGGAARRAADVPEEFTGSGTFHATVLGDGGNFTLLMSNDDIGMSEREIFSYTVPGFTAEDAYFGFSAGTGGAVTRHIVDNFSLQVASGEEAPTADFTATNRTGAAPLAVTFTDRSTGDVDTWFWEFGDGDTSTSRNPIHTYDVAGTYSVSLTVEGPGGSNKRTRSGYVTVSAPAGIDAEFVANPTIGAAPLQVTFTNQSTNATSYFWEFGDGGTSTAANPSHVYTQPGQHTVRLTATGAGGAQDVRERLSYIQVDDEIVADFTATPRNGEAPLVVQFIDLSSGSTITSHNWSFGDGMLSTTASPSHTYTQNGVYTVRLQVFGFGSLASEEKVGFIRVGVVEPVFKRGDANGDGGMDISDPVQILNYLFRGTATITCLDAADADDNGRLEITDASRILNYLFLNGPPPEPPFPDAGVDPNDDALAPCEL